MKNVIIVILILALGGAGYYFYTEKWKKTEETVTEKPTPKPGSTGIDTTRTPSLPSCDIMEDPTLKGLTVEQQLEKLNGKIVVIKSMRWNGAYVDANHTGGARVTEVPRSKLLDAIWSKFILHHIEGRVFCLESVRYPDHYLDMGHDYVCRFTSSNDIPRNEDWARFSIHGEDLTNLGIRSERWDKTRWLDAHHSGNLVGTYHASDSRPTEKWGQFQIMFPGAIVSKYEVVHRLKNNSPRTLKQKIKYQVGWSQTKGERVTNTVEISTEMQKNFGTPAFSSGHMTVGAKFSTEWESASENTWQESKEVELDIEVPPNSELVIKQLKGIYGEAIDVGLQDYIVCSEDQLTQVIK